MATSDTIACLSTKVSKRPFPNLTTLLLTLIGDKSPGPARIPGEPREVLPHASLRIDWFFARSVQLRQLLLATHRSPHNMRRLQLRGQVLIHWQRHRQRKQHYLRRGVARLWEKFHECKDPVYVDREIPNCGALAQWCWLCGGRYILLPAILCDWRAWPARQPTHLSSILRALQWPWQHRPDRKALFRIYHARHISL